MRAAAYLVASLLLPVSGFAQSADIVAHPRELSFDALSFDPPAAERHRHTLANGGRGVRGRRPRVAIG